MAALDRCCLGRRVELTRFSAATVFELLTLKDQVSGKRIGRRRGRRPLTVRDDGVRNVRAVGWLGVGIEHFLT